MRKRRLIVTCEHGGNRVPARWRALFSGAKDVLASHRGFDAGAKALAEKLRRSRSAALHICTTTRLLADTNRSLHHRSLFSEWTKELARDERMRILDECWHPYRTAVVKEMESAKDGVLHVSSHSFTPIWDGEERRVDVGFLYDPSRTREGDFASAWIENLSELRPELRLRRNNPYRGTVDGFVPWLRKHFTRERYVGIELEVNQAFVGANLARLQRDLVRSFPG